MIVLFVFCKKISTFSLTELLKYSTTFIKKKNKKKPLNTLNFSVILVTKKAVPVFGKRIIFQTAKMKHFKISSFLPCIYRQTHTEYAKSQLL